MIEVMMQAQKSALQDFIELDAADVFRGSIVVLVGSFLGVFLMIQAFASPENDSSNGAVQALTTETPAAPAAPESESEVVDASSTSIRDVFGSRYQSANEPLGGPRVADDLSAEESPSEDDKPELRSSEDIVVTVLNGSGIKGIAGRVSELLEEDEYDVTTPGNAAGSESESVVFYVEGYESEAEQLAKDLGSSELELSRLTSSNQPLDDLDGVHIVVVVGRDDAISV